MSLSFSYDTRFFSENKRLYFRKGVWNTIDGVIEISKIENPDLFLEKICLLQNGQALDEKDVELFSENDKKHFSDLISMGFIINNEVKTCDEAIKILTGQNYVIKGAKTSFTLVTDSDFLEENIKQLATIYEFSYTRLDEDLMLKLSDMEIFSKVNSLDYEKNKNLYSSKLMNAPILVLLNNANVPLLRNLNLLASKERPLFIGFIDGPFMIFLSIIPNVTACWSCFEQRMQAFLKDHVLYNKFVSIKNNFTQTNIYNLQLTNLLHLGMQEVVSWCQIKMSKFMGRVLFVYLPTYEVHFHNIDRISSCDYCGYIARETCKNSNISLNHVLGEFLRERGLEHGNK